MEEEPVPVATAKNNKKGGKKRRRRLWFFVFILWVSYLILIFYVNRKAIIKILSY